MENFITFTNVQKQYEDKIALAECNLSLKKGEVFALLGPNGAGKTTLIKLLCGITSPNRGVVRIMGFDMNEHPIEAKRCLGLAPEIPWVYDYLTGRQFLEFIGKLRDLSENLLKERIDQLANELILNEYLDELGKGFSYGTKRRFLLAAALLAKPEILVVDEIYNGLDPIQIQIAQNIIKEYAIQGNTVILSTHILKLANEVADRIGIISNGRLLEVGEPDKLCQENDVNDLSDLFFKVSNQ